jgi:site-specific recombinase XerD
MSELIPRHLRHLRARGFAHTTIESRSRLLRHADRYLPYGLDEADREDLEEYLSEQQWSDWTRHTYDGHLRGYYRWAIDVDDGLAIDPTRTMPHPKKGECLPDPVTDDELAAALRRSPRQPWGMAIMLCAYAGLRGSEAARLKREDVTEARVRVRDGKGGRDGLVDTAPELWRYLRDAAPGPLIRAARGRPMTGKYLINYQCHHWRAIGMPSLHLHRFRHWFGTTLLRNGTDLRTIQELMRHKSIVSTQGYTLVVDEQRKAAIATLPNMRAPAEL